MPRFTSDFYQANIEKFEQPEYVAKLTAHIWDHYGQRFFNLFDVRQTTLWDQYVNFNKECAKIDEEEGRNKGRISDRSDLYWIC